jgi:hypothetical protein
VAALPVVPLQALSSNPNTSTRLNKIDNFFIFAPSKSAQIISDSKAIAFYFYVLTSALRLRRTKNVRLRSGRNSLYFIQQNTYLHESKLSLFFNPVEIDLILIANR